MVKGVIYDEPAVVGFVAPLTDVDVGRGEKSVVFLHEVGHTLAHAFGVDDGLDSSFSHIKKAESETGDVGIDEDDAPGGGLDDGFKCSSRSIEVSFKEDHLCWWCRGADEKIELLLLFGLSVFDAHHALVHTFL